MNFNYGEIENYYDFDYWNTPGKKSGYINMAAAIGGEWHKQACAWFNSVIPVKNKALFDAGCGLGHFMLAFHNLGAKVSGCDVSDYCAEFVQQKVPGSFFHTSLEKMAGIPKNFYDIVFTGATMEHIPQDSAEVVLQNLIRIAKPGGLIYIEIDVKPDNERDFPEESHVNIRPWAQWLAEFDKFHYPWFPEYNLTHRLRETKEFPGFPLPDWRFFVFQKPKH